MSLHASERQAFCALFFAFENFVTGVAMQYANARNRPRGWKSIEKLFAKAFAPLRDRSVQRSCLGDRVILAARHMRDAIAHRGGRANVATNGFPEIEVAADGTIVVGAASTWALYETLVPAVLGLLRASRRLESATQPRVGE